MCVRSFIAACLTFIKDVYELYKVGIYEWFWAFAYLFVKRKRKVIRNENILVTGTGLFTMLNYNLIYTMLLDYNVRLFHAFFFVNFRCCLQVLQLYD